MTKETFQIKKWKSGFGDKYTDRNTFTPFELDDMYRKNSGVSRTEMNKAFLGKMDRDMRILEVGCNVGNQLIMLQRMGFKNLYGVEINGYAVEKAKSRTKGINIIQGTAFDLPFKDGFFDMVYTAGVLIHINPKDIKKVLREIHRCSRRYIWGYEFWAPRYTNKFYRGYDNLFWKTDFSKLYMGLFGDLNLVKEEYYKYLECDDVDVMYLLKKRISRRGR